jgi:hypothetical protein
VHGGAAEEWVNANAKAGRDIGRAGQGFAERHVGHNAAQPIGRKHRLLHLGKCVREGEDSGATCTGTKGPPSGKLLSLLVGGFSRSNARPVSAIATRRRSAAAMAGARSCPNVSICLRSTPSSALAAIASRAGKGLERLVNRFLLERRFDGAPLLRR